MLDSDWLLRMLAKSAPTPRARLLALFDILGDWIEAPHMRQALAGPAPPEGGCPRLLSYLAEQARASGANQPDALAYQLYFMTLGALHEELREPGCGAMLQARHAAKTLLSTQTLRQGGAVIRYALAAALLVMALGLPLSGDRPDDAAVVAGFDRPIPDKRHTIPQQSTNANPVQVAALYGAIEQMRKGVCHYPQALMLPSEQRAVYLENVVGGMIPMANRNPQELYQLVQKVDCYYPPVAMTAS